MERRAGRGLGTARHETHRLPRHHAGADLTVILQLEFRPLQLRDQLFRARRGGSNKNCTLTRKG
jgi:hypothetical protein